MRLDPGAPGPAHGIEQPAVGGTAAVGDREAMHDFQFVGARHARRRRLGFAFELQAQYVFLLAAEQRENTMRRQLAQRLGKIEIVGKFGTGLHLAFAHFGNEPALRPELFAQGPDQVGIFGKALGQDRARAFKRRRHIRHLLSRRHSGRGGLRIVRRLAQQQLGQRLEAGFLGDLGLGAALRLERQVDVLKPALVVGGANRRFQGGIEFALFAHRRQDRFAAVFQFAQIFQPFVERAQLGIVERAGDFLAVARHEGNSGAAVEQFDRRRDLLNPNGQFIRDAPEDRIGQVRIRRSRIRHRVPVRKRSRRRFTGPCL